MRSMLPLLVAVWTLLPSAAAFSSSADATAPTVSKASPASGSAATGESPAPAPANACDAARARAAAAAIQRRYDAIDHLAADFEQTTESVVLGMGALPGESNAETTRGRVVFAKPGRMRWSYLEPAESYVVSDGSVLWIYDVAARQATRLPVGEQVLAGAALQFLLGEGRLAESFEISAVACSEGSIELDLEPIGPASYERLGLGADPVTGLVSETSIVDLFGNRTRIRFSRVVTDQPPAPGTFRFEPPKGVEINDMGEVR